MTPWDAFAAAWLAKTIVIAPPHGETPESYAGKQAELAAAVADRMMELRAQRFDDDGQPQARPVQPVQQSYRAQLQPHRAIGLTATNAPTVQRVAPPATQATSEALAALGGQAAPGEYIPTADELKGQPCWRAFNGKVRGQGEDCPGLYDTQGVCNACRLAYKMPGDAPRQFAASYGPPPVVIPRGQPESISAPPKPISVPPLSQPAPIADPRFAPGAMDGAPMLPGQNPNGAQ